MKEYFPTYEELELSPLLDQSADPDDYTFFETRDPDRANRPCNYVSFPFHATQKYEPQLLDMEARHAKLTKEYDTHFVKAQKATAHLTHPLDLLLHQCLQAESQHEITEAVISFH